MASEHLEKDGLLQELYTWLGQIVSKNGNWEKISLW